MRCSRSRLRFDGSALRDGGGRRRRARSRIPHGPGDADVGRGSDREQGVTGVAFSPDGNTLFCGRGRGGAREQEIGSGRPLHSTSSLHRPKGTRSIARSIPSALARTAARWPRARRRVNQEFGDAVRIWDARTGTLKRDFTAENIRGRPMALSPDGSIVATGGKSVKLWDVRTGKLLHELFGHLKRTQSIVLG